MSDYNEDELHPPSWLNEKYLTNVLVKSENDKSVKITKLTITPGSGKGDHYASVMFRAVVIYDTAISKGNSKSMVIKTIPEAEGAKKDMLGQSNVFEIEISMYTDTIPAFEAELRRIGDNTVLGARMLHYSLGEIQCIIFDDLVAMGFSTIGDKMMTITEAKAALLKLAKWHAVSYKLAAEGNKLVTGYSKGFLAFRDAYKMPLVATGIEKFIVMVEGDEELKKYAPKLKALKPELVKNCIKSFTSFAKQKNVQGVYALCHGDFHAKNMMFKWSDKDKLEDVMLFDFQICYFGPAVLDILYAKYLLLTEDLRKNHYEELIYYYSSSFIDILKKLNFKGEYPAIADFYIDILRHKHWDLFLLSTFLPMAYKVSSEKVGAEQVMESDDFRAKLYENVGYKTEIKRLLPIMFHMGYLD